MVTWCACENFLVTANALASWAWAGFSGSTPFCLPSLVSSAIVLLMSGEATGVASRR